MSNEKSHGVMLGRIACLVEEFCQPEETTLQGVAHLLARYMDLRAKEAWDFVDQLKEEDYRTLDCVAVEGCKSAGEARG